MLVIFAECHQSIPMLVLIANMPQFCRSHLSSCFYSFFWSLRSRYFEINNIRKTQVSLSIKKEANYTIYLYSLTKSSSDLIGGREGIFKSKLNKGGFMLGENVAWGTKEMAEKYLFGWVS